MQKDKVQMAMLSRHFLARSSAQRFGRDSLLSLQFGREKEGWLAASETCYNRGVTTAGMASHSGSVASKRGETIHDRERSGSEKAESERPAN